MTLFPHMLVRIAGGEFTDFKKTELKQTFRVLQKISVTEQKYQHVKEQISEQLYGYVATVTDNQVRKVLIQIRRDVHNGRPISYVPAEVQASLPSRIRQLLARYDGLGQQLQSLEEKGRQLYELESKKAQRAFTGLLKDPNFRNGLLLSSNTILDSLKTYRKADSKQKNYVKLERSLTKYLSRMYTKPTPFSTFTDLALATLQSKEGDDSLGLRSNAPLKIDSHLQLNHALYGYLYGLLVQNPQVRKHLSVKTNPTVSKAADQYVFLANNYNREAFQRITITPALEFFYTLSQAQEKWRYDELIAEVVERKYVDATAEQIADYVDKLISYGLLEYDLGVSGIDLNWDQKLADSLLPLSAQLPYVKELVTTLKQLRKWSLQYAKASPGKREVILRNAFVLFRDTCAQLHSAAGLPEEERASFQAHYAASDSKTPPPRKTKTKKEEPFKHTYGTAFTFKPQNLWYEDCAVHEPLTLSSGVKESLDALGGDLLARLGSFDGCLEKRYEIAHFFNAAYKPGAKVDLLQFYEDYCREEKRIREKKPGSSKNPVLAERNKKNRQSLNVFMRSINHQLESKDQVDIRRQNVEHIGDGPGTQTQTSSCGAFLQICDQAGKPVLVINSTSPGFGKMFSRFLYLFDQQVTQSLRDAHKKLASGVLLAEATDASFFNANLHPRLMPYEVQTPGGHSLLPAAAGIPVTDIEVTYNDQEQRLMLLDKKRGKEIFVFDLGFQGTGGRSKLHGFLAYFTLGAHHHTSPLTNRINKKIEKRFAKDEPIVLPRIIYEDCVVLQRKTWRVPKKFLPARQPGDSDWDYFLKVNIWRTALHLPDEIFVTIKQGHKTKDSKAVVDYKPQYICFANPYLLSLFEKIVQKTAGTLKIEEMMPGSDQLLALNDQKYITEFFAQWELDGDY